MWEPGNEFGCVLGQRRDTPDNEKWSRRWQSNPHGRCFRAFVQDELDRRHSRLIDRRFALSGLLERKDQKDFDWLYSKIPKREVLELELAALRFNSFAGTASSLSPAS
jgi:hypothetical protein